PMGPKDGWNIQAQRKPERMRGTAHGMTTRDLKKAEHFTIRFKQRAKITLVRSVKPVEPKENMKVRATTKGRTGSFNAVL
ncbi:MAG: hypothetical protein ACE5NJ_10080, partial [Thermodesulfobacteriota bacterium]